MTPNLLCSLSLSLTHTHTSLIEGNGLQFIKDFCKYLIILRVKYNFSKSKK